MVETFVKDWKATMLNIDDLQPGDRVVLRYRLNMTQQLPSAVPLTDALGETVEVTADSITVQTRKGPVQVPRRAITHAKRVPPPPPRRRPTT